MGYAVYKLSKEDAAIFNKLSEKCWDGEKRDLSKLNKYERAVLQKLMDEAGKHEPKRVAKNHTFADVIAKFNPYHDKLGRFTTAGGAMSFTWRTKDSSKQHLANRAVEREKERTKNTFVSVISGKKYDMPELENENAYAYREKALRHVEKYFSSKKPNAEKYDEKMKRYLEETDTAVWEKRSRATLSTISHSFVSAKTPSERKKEAEYKKDRESHSKALDRAAMKRTPKYKEYESYKQSLVEKYTKGTWDKHGWYSKLTQAEKDKLAELQEATVFRNKRGQWQIAKSYEDPNVIELEIVEKFNPYHDKLGRFTTASGATAFTWRTKDSSKQHLADKAIQRAKDAHAASAKQENDGDKARKAVRAVEDKIKHQKYETAATFDRNGNLLFMKDGSENTVPLYAHETAVMKDAIFTHNHPGSGPFSRNDIWTFVDTELYEIRATTERNGTFVLRRTEKTNKADSDYFKALYPTLLDEAYAKAQKELDDKGYFKMITSGKMTEEQANKDYVDAVVGYVNKSASKWANLYGFEFVVEKGMVEKFNPYHDKLGRFTTASGATLFTWRTKDSSKQLLASRAINRERKAHLKKEIHSVEDKIRHQNFESCALFDKRGNQLFFKNGAESQVEFEYWEVAKMRDGVLTHNHPSCNTFSKEDVNMLVKSGLSEIRATNRENTTYILRRTKDTTFEDGEKFSDLYQYLDALARQNAQIELDNRGYYEKIMNGKITHEQANIDMRKLIVADINRYMDTFAPLYHFEYEVEQR